MAGTFLYQLRFALRGLRKAPAFTAAVSILTGILFGLAPAIQSLRVDLNGALKQGSRGAGGSGWLRRALVACQVAFGLVLLVAAGLLLKSFARLLEVNPGFEPDNVITVSMSPYRPGTNDQRIEQVCAYYREVIRRLETLPGVIAVGGTDNFPFTRRRTDRNSLTIEAKGDMIRDIQVRAPANFADITPRYFEAMSIPVLEGRAFTEADTRTAPKVIILSERGAKELFPGRSALGGQVRAGAPGYMDPWATVGGVKYRAQEDGRNIEFYYPYTQYGLNTAHLAVRTRGGGRALQPAIRAAVAAADPETAVDEIKPLRELIDDSLWQQRLWGFLLAAYAGVA